jgi:serine/threonine-protein kinase HipA
MTERLCSVWLQDRRAGTIHQRGDYTRFTLDEDYRTDPERAVLGLLFEQDLTKPHTAALRLPPWFSNLLPEGPFRDWIAADRGVSAHREMELLAQVGHDLPGAVRVLPDEEAPDAAGWKRDAPKHEAWVPEGSDHSPRWRFSLAGVGLKFSMLAKGDRLTLSALARAGIGSSNFLISAMRRFLAMSIR